MWRDGCARSGQGRTDVPAMDGEAFGVLIVCPPTVTPGVSICHQPCDASILTKFSGPVNLLSSTFPNS